MRYDQLISRNNLDLALSRIGTASNHQYKRFIRPTLLAIEPARDDFIRRLRSRLRGAWTPQAPRRIYIPKASGLQRPITLLELEDQIVLQAVANAFAEKLRRRRVAVSNRVVFSNILNTEPRSIFFVERWQTTYAGFQSACENHYRAGHRWVAHFDLSAFYDTISHDLLLKQVSPRGGDQRTWDRVRSWLRVWSAEASNQPFAHGIPQGPIASDFLAECFLLPIDEKLGRSGIRYVRYVDDIRIFARTREDAQRAVLILERLCRNLGLIPQGSKFAISRVRSVSDAMGGLPSLAPPGDQGGGGSLTAAEARKLFEEAIDGRPYRIKDRSKARYVLYRAPRVPRIMQLVVKLLPRHPEHIDAFAFYLRGYGRCVPTERVCSKLLRAGTPYSYLRGELWQLLADVGSDAAVRALGSLATDDLRTATSPALRWGAMRFLLKAETIGGRSVANRVRHQPGLIQGLLTTDLPETAYQADAAVGRLLRDGGYEVGSCLAGELIARGLSHRDFGLRVSDLSPIVQELFRSLGLVSRRRGAHVDQIDEVLVRRFGTQSVPKWRYVLGLEYNHALQILTQAEFVFDAGPSSWLQHQDSFNDILTRSMIGFLGELGLLGEGQRTVDRHGVRIDFGRLLDANASFSRHHAVAAGPLRVAHRRRNSLPASHPYDKRTGHRNQFLTAHQQRQLVRQLSAAYVHFSTLVDANA